MKKTVWIFAIVTVIIFGVGFYYFLTENNEQVNLKSRYVDTKMEITSSAFDHNQPIPQRYTCDGEDINPPLTFSKIPQNSQSLVLIVDDPDAPVGTWNHWLVYNIPSSILEISENTVPERSIEIANSFDQKKYGGPCPPPGESHRYYFKIYSLDTILPAEIRSKEELEQKIQNHILAQSELIGTYGR